MSDNSFAGINIDSKESMKIFEKHNNTMCSSYKKKDNILYNIKVDLKKNENGFLISGKLNNNLYEKRYIKYIAANPPTYNSNFSGSGLPYPSEEIAYENTPNKGIVEIINGQFNITIKYPNSYYINMGSKYIEPNIKLSIVDNDNNNISETMIVILGEGIPFRTLTWPVQRKWSDGPLFYKTNVDLVRTQYQILLDSAYPIKNKIPDNFWGMKPPN